MKDMTQSRLFLLVLIVATGLGPLAMQIFLPSLPAIQADLRVSPAAAQLVLSLSIVAIAVSMLIYGPLSDRFGRRPVFIVGLTLFLCGSLVATLAPTIVWLVIGRVVQAAGGAGAMVLTRTIVRDLYTRERAVSMIAYITMAMVVAPMLAPLIGGYVNDQIGWRANFALVGIVGVFVTALVVARLPETHHGQVAMPGIGSIVRVYGQLLRMPSFCGFALQSAFSIATFFAFAAAAPYVVIELMDRPAQVYGTFFVLLSTFFMAGNFLAGRISERVGVERMVLIGSSVSLLGTVLSLTGLLVFGWVPWSLFGPIVLVGLGNGLSMPNAMAGAISVDPRNAGAASGFAGFLQMLTAAVFAQLAGMWQNGTPYPMMGFMVAGALLALLVFIRSQRAIRLAPTSVAAE